MKYFIENGVWDAVNATVLRIVKAWPCCDYGWEEIHYLLMFQRQSRYYVITVIVPSMTLSLVSLLVFFMPPNSEEKVSLASSNLLAMLLFQELVSTSMPPIGTEFPLIGSFFVASIVVNTISIFSSILIMYLHNKHNNPVPTWLRKVAIIKSGPGHAQQTTTERKNWVMRRLSGFNYASTLSHAVHLRHSHDRVQKNFGVNLIGFKGRDPTPITKNVPADQAQKVEEKNMKQEFTAGGGNDGATECKEDFSYEWQELALKVNRLMAVLLTSSILLTASVIIFLYIVQEDEEFPDRT